MTKENVKHILNIELKAKYKIKINLYMLLAAIKKKRI